MEKPRCRLCQFCKDTGRAAVTSNARNGYSRKSYMCEHPKAKELPQSAFGNKMACFIGFGDCTYESKVQVKTAPKWCPRKEMEHYGKE